MLATIPDGTTLAAGSFYLFGGSGYSGSPAADQSFSAGLASTAGGVGIRDADGTLVDSVGYGATAANGFVEANTCPGAADDGRSGLERRPQVRTGTTRTTTRSTSQSRRRLPLGRRTG